MNVSAASTNNAAMAKDINRFLVKQGGEAIPGLETLDPVKLKKLQTGMQEFVDRFGGAGSDLEQMVGSNAIESMREFAQLLSQKGTGAPAQGARRVGFCGGAPAACPPPAPAAPPPPAVVSPESRRVSPEGPVVVGALSTPGGTAQPFATGGAAPTNVATDTINAVLNNRAATFNPFASNFVPNGALGSTLRSSPTSGFNPLAALNQSVGLATVGASLGALALGSVSGVDPNLESLQNAGSGGGFFEDKVFGLMIKIVADMQKNVEERLTKLQEEAKAAEKGGGKKKGKGGFLGGVVKSVVGVAAPIVGAAIGGPVGGMIGSAVGKAVSGSGGAAGAAGGSGAAGGAAGGQESRNIEFEKIKFDMQKLSQMQQALSNILNTMDELAKSAIRNIKGG